jgi:hypothetical protein
MSVLKMFRGDTRRYAIAVTRNGSAEDLTGAQLWFTARPANDSTDRYAIAKTIGTGLTVTNPTGGLVTLQIDPADTAALSLVAPMTFVYDVQLKTVGNDVETIDSGTLIINPDVTKPS